MNSQHRQHYGEEDLLLYYYGEVSPEERSGVESHLAGCHQCREAWRTLQRTLSSIPRVSLSVSREESRRFAARVARQAGRRRLSRGWLWGGTLATTALLAALTLSVRPSGLLPGGNTNTRMMAEATIMKDLDLLQNLEMLEELDLLQELDGQG